MAGKSPYSDEDRARVYTTLVSNEGNVKRTARDTGVPVGTIRDWKKAFEENPPPVEALAVATGEWLDDAKRVRHKATLEIERQIDAHEMRGAALVTTVGVLDDKITRVDGIVAKSRVDHIHHLPSGDEVRALLGGLVSGALEAGRTRQEEIVDAEFEEQAPKALPASRP